MVKPWRRGSSSMKRLALWRYALVLGLVGLIFLGTAPAQRLQAETSPSWTPEYPGVVNYWPDMWTYITFRQPGGGCYNRSSCYFETMVDVPISGKWIRSLTYGGRYWNYEIATGRLASSGTLSSVSRFANGPCRYAANCQFSYRDFFKNPSGVVREYVEVGDYFWIWDMNGNLLRFGTRWEFICPTRACPAPGGQRPRP